MKFPVRLGRLRNTQGGRRSAARSGYSTYTPPDPPVDPPMPDPPPEPPPPVLDPSRPTVTIHVPRPEVVTHEPFNVTVEFSESVNGFMQAELEVGGTSGASITAWNPGSSFTNYVATITTENWPGTATFNVAENVAMNEFGFGNIASVEVTVNIPQESFNFTGLLPGTPLPTFPYPTPSALPYDPDAPIPVSPDYAVPINRVHTPVPEPVITVQAERKFSDFEKHIARTIFGSSPSFSDMLFENKLKIYVDALLTNTDPITHEPTHPKGQQGDGRIGISRAKFPYTPAFDADSTLEDFTTAELNSVGMLQFIFTFTHELAHWWQGHQNRHDNQSNVWRSGYKEQQDRYRFNEAQLAVNKFVDFEAHASAVATYAVIKWQLENRPEGQLINLTKWMGRNLSESVGSIERYMKLRAMDYQPSPTADYATAPPVGTWITRDEANTLLSDFSVLANEIETAAPVGG